MKTYFSRSDNTSYIVDFHELVSNTEPDAHLVDSTGKRHPVHSSLLRLKIPLLRHAPHFDDVILDDLLPGSAELIVELIYGLDRLFKPSNPHLLDNFWEAALTVGWKDLVDWRETPPTSRASLFSSTSPSFASESATSPEKSGPDKVKPSTDVRSGLWNQDLMLSDSHISSSPTRAASVSSLTSPSAAQQEVEFHQQTPRSVPTPVALSLSCSSSSPSRDLTGPSSAVLAQQEVELHQQTVSGPILSSSVAGSISPTQESKNFKFCKVCMQKISAHNFVRHCLLHGGSTRPLQCELCGQKFTRVDHVKRHIELNCKRNRLVFKVPCSRQCGEWFKSTYTAKKHCRTACTTKLSCENCGQDFHMKKQLTKHKKTCSLANRVGLKSPNLPALNASAPSHSKSSVRKPEEMERQGMSRGSWPPPDPNLLLPLERDREDLTRSLSNLGSDAVSPGNLSLISPSLLSPSMVSPGHSSISPPPLGLTGPGMAGPSTSPISPLDNLMPGLGLGSQSVSPIPGSSQPILRSRINTAGLLSQPGSAQPRSLPSQKIGSGSGDAATSLLSSKKKTCPIAPLIGDEDDYSDPTDHLDENEDNIGKVSNLRTISDFILGDFDADL